MERGKDTSATIEDNLINTPGTGLFFVGIIYNGDDKQLASSLKSALRQKLAGSRLIVYIFHNRSESPNIDLSADSTLIPFFNDQDFFQRFIEIVERSEADYYAVLWGGEEFFDSTFDSVEKIFKKYDQVNWLTGIQTFQARNGFNIALGNTSFRRWSYQLYERNLYKNSGRYIPPGSTFWRKSVWKSSSTQLHFVSQKTFCEDLWLAFFKSQKLYTCKIYFSTSGSYEKPDRSPNRPPAKYDQIEDGLIRRLMEFFFINNIPYLRLFYRATSNLAPVIRFDHSTQSYFLSEY
jgi:hypothetical protein